MFIVALESGEYSDWTILLIGGFFSLELAEDWLGAYASSVADLPRWEDRPDKASIGKIGMPGDAIDWVQSWRLTPSGLAESKVDNRLRRSFHGAVPESAS